MREHNYISEELANHPTFLTDLDKSTERFFKDEKLETLYKKGSREIKAYRDDENMVVYLLDKNKNKIKVTIDEIHYFNKKSTVKEIIYWQYKEKNGKVDDDLHMIKVFTSEAERKESKKRTNQTENDYIENLFKSLKGDKGMEGLIKNIKSLFGENFLSNKEFLKSFGGGTKVECASDINTLKEYTTLLNNKGLLTKVYEDSFFLELNKESFKEVQKNIPEWNITIDALIRACEKNKFTSSKKAFEFNDLDNHVWIKSKNLILTSQNVGFYFDIQDNNNYNVYLLETEYKSVDKEVARIENGLKENNINKIKDLVLSVKDGNVTGVNYSLMYCFELDVKFSGKAMESEGILERQYPIDIQSYEYQKNYYYERFGLSEFEFIAQAVLTLGGGFDYNKETGKFIDDDINYIPNLKEAPNTRDKTFKNFNYCYPKKISHLNEDWLNAIKYMVEVLKRDNPVPVAFEGDNPKDAVQKAIKYFEIKINKLEDKNKPKI